MTGIDWNALHLLRPQWLWALAALPALWAAWRWRRRQRDVWRRQVDPHLLPHLIAPGPRWRGTFAWIALGWTLAVLALAGPSWRQGAQPLWQPGAPLVIALDLSPRAQAGDLPPSRLVQARAKIAALLRQREGGQVALLAYAGDAFTVAPLTEDAANVALFLDALSPEVMPVAGQRADRAIHQAQRLLAQAGFEQGEILLLTDRADADALRAAAQASTQGYRVSALGLGTAAGAPYREADGRLERAALDAGSLRALASAGGGRYAALTADDGDLDALGVLTAVAADMASAKPRQGGGAWQDEGYWLLPPLMLLALLAFRRGGGLACLLAAGLCLPLALALPAQAQARQDDGSLWQRPDQQRHQRIERGAQAYRQGDYAAAQQAFEGIDTPEGWYNLGNALARQGRYDEAIEAYDRALAQRPRMEDALANRAAVEAARKRRQQGDGQQGQQGRQGQQEPQRQQGERPEAGQSGQSNPRAGSAASTPPSAPPSPPSPPRQEDRQAQQAADAAQRERMRQAMQAAGRLEDGDARDGAAAAAISAEERERRQAVEAWLRRIPDDPGGLLKLKFRLEYERRLKEGTSP